VNQGAFVDLAAGILALGVPIVTGTVVGLLRRPWWLSLAASVPWVVVAYWYPFEGGFLAVIAGLLALASWAVAHVFRTELPPELKERYKRKST
jgi:hypothetical protein